MSQTLAGTEFKAIRKMCGFSAREVAEFFKSQGLPVATVRTIYRIEEEGEVPLRYSEALKGLVGKPLFKQSLTEIRRREKISGPATRGNSAGRPRRRGARSFDTSHYGDLDQDRVSIREEQFLRFLNSLPIAASPVLWITAFREALQDLLGDVDRVVMNVNLACDINNPRDYQSNQIVTEHIQEEGSNWGGVEVSMIREGDSPHLRLLEDFKRQGYPLERYQPPVGIDYHLAEQAYLGTLFLWREIEKPPISQKTLHIMETLHPFMLFVLSDLVARHRQTRPLDSFNLALSHMVTTAGLSEQERRVVMLQLFGHSYDQIADRLRLSLDAVRKHVKSIYRKTGTHSYIELFAKYFTPRLGF
jgi:DNA-binding CsgD family transcriptional regulator